MIALLDSTARTLDHALAATQREARLPSVVAGLVRDGELVWTGSRGRAVGEDWATDPSRALGTSDTQYKIGSLTKTMTAALIMLARERGEVSLDDRVGRFLPDGPCAEATLRALLCHAAGVSAEPSGQWWERAGYAERAGFVAAHVGGDPVLEPLSQLHYSNLGYGVLGEVASEVYGTSWYAALREHVLDPLGMNRTTYAAESPSAAGFSVDDLTDELCVEPLPDTGALAAAGQLWSTVDDLARWSVALIDPERSVLTERSLVAMRTPLVGTPEDRLGLSWGLGMHVLRTEGRLLIGHGGSMPGFMAGLQIDVDARMASVMLTNGAWGVGDLTKRLLMSAVAAEPAMPVEWAPSESVPEAAREVVGTWYWGNAPSRARWSGGELRWGPVGPGRVMAFAPRDDGTWVGVRGYLTGEVLRPVRGDDGVVSHLECATFVFTRTPYDPAAPIPGA